MAATEELHREVGPARTTIADVARRAGVQRLTVYSNFPDLGDLFAACQGLFLRGHPPPDLMPVGSDPSVEQALRQQYAWYRANQAMVSNIQRDRHLVPELDALLRSGSDRLFDAAAAAHADLIATDPARRSAVRMLVRLGFEFTTWQVLSAEGKADREIAAMLANAALCAAG